MELAYQVWSETFCDVPIIGGLSPTSEDNSVAKDSDFAAKKVLDKSELVVKELHLVTNEDNSLCEKPLLTPSFGEDGFGLNGVTDGATEKCNRFEPDKEPYNKPLTLTLPGERSYSPADNTHFKNPPPKVELLDFAQATPPLISPNQSKHSPTETVGHSPKGVLDEGVYENGSVSNIEPLVVNTNSGSSLLDTRYHGHDPSLGGPDSHNSGQALVNQPNTHIPNGQSFQSANGQYPIDSPLSVRCTTQATVALLSKNSVDNHYPYSNGAAFPPHSNSVIPQPRFVTPSYADRAQFAYPAQRYQPYSPLPGSVPYHSNGYPVPQYYNGYGLNPNYGCINPQFPPQNYLDFPDISHSNSVYANYSSHSHHYNHPAYQGHIMNQREPILNTMDGSHGNGNPIGCNEPIGMQGAGFGAVPRESDSDDGQSPNKLSNIGAARKKRGASPGKDEASKPKKAKSPKKRKKKDPNEPQKPVSAYAMFFRDTQASIKSSNPAATFGEVSKIVASMWDSLEDESKSDYKKRTEIAKKEYLQKLAAYRASLVSSGGLDHTSGGSSGTDSSPRESPERINQSDSLSQQRAPPMHQSDPLTQQPMHQSPPRIEQAPPPMGMPQFESVQQPQTGLPLESANSMMVSQPAGEEPAPRIASNEMAPQNGESGANQEAGGGEQEEPNQPHQPTIQTSVFYGKAQHQIAGELAAQQCVREGCGNQGVSSPQWDSEYCSNQCVVDHCRDVFTAWVASRSGYTSVN